MARSFVHLLQRIFSQPHFSGEKPASRWKGKLISAIQLALCRLRLKNGVFYKQQKFLTVLNVS